MTGENTVWIEIDEMDFNEAIDIIWPIEDGRVPLDLTSATLSMKIKETRDSASATLECTSGNGNLTAPTAGTVRLKIPAGSLPVRAEGYVFDALYTLGGVARSLWKGVIFEVRKGIT